MPALPRELYDEIVGHALEGWPDEVCGLVAAQPGEGPVRTYRVHNSAETPRTRYLMEPREQFEAMMEIEDRGWELYGIYHSHPSTEAYPSQTDRSLAYYPDAIYLICTLQDRERPQLRAFNILDDGVHELQVRIAEPKARSY